MNGSNCANFPDRLRLIRGMVFERARSGLWMPRHDYIDDIDPVDSYIQRVEGRTLYLIENSLITERAAD